MARSRKTIPDTLIQSKSLAWLLGLAFVAATLLTALLTFMVVRDAVRAWSDARSTTGASINAPAEPAPAITMPLDQPLQAAGGPPAVPWDGDSRINILFMGLDYRDWQVGDGPPRTDTMILLTIDPQSKTAGMLSIPRDLWVNVPGFNYTKINTAYYYGEAFQTPGGGAALAMETVQNFLGVPVHYYAQVDFGAFVRLIDEIGGVVVDVPESIVIDLIGSGPETKKHLEPGRQTLPGEWALAYARMRDTAGSDFDRSERQQQVILAVRERVMRFDMIPTLIRKAPAIYSEIASGVNTNLTLDQIFRLGWVVKDVSPESIQRGVIGPDQVTFGFSPEGLSILVPIPEEIRVLRDDIFAAEGTINPISTVTGATVEELVIEEDARIAIQNGTYTPGLGSATSEFLVNEGFNVVEVANADQLYEMTTIIDYTGNPYTLRQLTDVLGINPSRIFSSYDPDRAYDIAVILGDDWAFRIQNP
jgi:polyisoprenyl-teichoic acid--peptidoglycan teichoic acid transferase